MEEYMELYERSVGPERDEFWREQAQVLRWQRPFKQVVHEDMPNGDCRWFGGGKINVCDNCVDRWAEENPDGIALIHEGDDPIDVTRYTWKELQMHVCRVANMYRHYGARSGEIVTCYMPMIPEACYCMLAAVRIGMMHSVVFAGFSAEALRDRLQDARSPWVVTCDEGLRAQKVIALKNICDEAMRGCEDFIRKCFVYRRTGERVEMDKHRDVWADETVIRMPPYIAPKEMNSDDSLFMLYTSGSTGKPKGVVHSTAGYLLWTALTAKLVFDVQAGDVFGCVADIGWITGHSYTIYGPFANGVTSLMFESVPTFPDPGRYWDMVERHKLTQFYTAPTALRSIMRYGNEFVTKYDRSSLRVLGSVGEPINPEAWKWYYEIVGECRCPIVDTFWQSETGGMMLTPLPGSHTLKPGSCTLPLLGVDVRVLDPTNGREMEGNDVAGVLVFKKSWPSVLKTLHGAHNRMVETYFKPYRGYYMTGDSCVRDQDGYYWITGRVDDVINISGHRIGSAEVEHALVSHEKSAEAAVVAYPHEVKGSGLFCYVTLKAGVTPNDDLRRELLQCVRRSVGPFALPDHIVFTSALPKTRSGKIMRRILRKIASDDASNLGDITTLSNPAIVTELMEKAKASLVRPA